MKCRLSVIILLIITVLFDAHVYATSNGEIFKDTCIAGQKLKQEKKYEEAIIEFTKALSIDIRPEYKTPVYWDIALTYISWKKVDLAMLNFGKFLKQASLLDKDDEFYINLNIKKLSAQAKKGITHYLKDKNLKDTVAVLKIEGDAGDIQAVIEGAFVDISPFKVVERSKLQSLIDEKKLSLSGLATDEKAVSSGKLIGATYCLFGVATKIDAENIQLSIKLVDVVSGKVLSTISNKYSRNNIGYLRNDVVYTTVSDVYINKMI